eukprot:COSAG03_NODE_542_length_7066_cov_460.167760_1_plen_51_part_00
MRSMHLQDSVCIIFAKATVRSYRLTNGHKGLMPVVKKRSKTARLGAVAPI